MPKQANTAITYSKYRPGRWEIINAKIITEAPVSLTVNGEIWLTFMCTPTDLEALAVGFLFNEGLIESADEIVNVSVCESGDNVDVWLSHLVEKPALWRRTTGCSGGMTSDKAATQPERLDRDAPPANGGPISPERIFALMDQLLHSQELYQESGGVHSSALSDGLRVVVRAEDIGRHNTLDKIAGRYVLDRLHLEHPYLVTTGRISSEMLQKARRIGASVVVSRTAPNSLSIQAAQEAGITLIGYARRDQFQVYSHPERLQGAPDSALFIPEVVEVSENAC
ncbi:MAG: formate dehydrogenase accessory sulfurtransferase FdhD [Chloroflexi bacterium]|nr:formate dehydrogenase accessory sulfurtransferase FdhD [Chloroflexota bacterium]